MDLNTHPDVAVPDSANKFIFGVSSDEHGPERTFLDEIAQNRAAFCNLTSGAGSLDAKDNAI